MKPLKALIFLAAGVVAALAVAWFAGAFAPTAPEAPQVATGAQDGATEKGDRPTAQQPAEPAQGEAPAAAAQAGAEVVPPSFDILRVEPDGSIVIAGRAAPQSKVEILSGSNLIGEAEAGAEGDFVAVLDEPLKPGDYQIVLRSTAPGNVVAASPETAIVSIPEQEDGQVLALVEQPGEPSRLITVPEPEAAAPQAAAPQASGAQPAQQTEAAAEAGASGSNGQQAAAVTEQPGAAAATGQDQAAASPQAGGAAAPAAGAGEQPPASSGMAAATPGTGGEPEASAPAAAADTGQAAPGAGEPTAPASGQPADTAAAPQAPAAPEQAAPQPAGQAVAVEAVEIEGRKVFVAGVAAPGSQVRVYANDILLGEAQASAAGRFLVETERDLPVGDYIIRADVLGAEGAVTARAAVPFEREEGETIAAVAPPAAAATEGAAPSGGGAASSEAGSTTGEQAAVAGGQQPQGEPVPSGSADASVSAGQPSTEGSVAAAPAEPSSAGSAPAESGAQASAGAATQDSASAPAGEGQGSAQSGSATGAGAAPQAGSDVAAAPTVTAPKLQPAQGAVIIRRGDNLWRISRRVYGRGVRYTTIYLANQDQISDPDRIWPGQVFAVPDTTPEGEAADMKAIGDRATTLPKE